MGGRELKKVKDIIEGKVIGFVDYIWRDIVTIQGQTNNTQSVPGVTDNWKTTFVEIWDSRTIQVHTSITKSDPSKLVNYIHGNLR